MAKHIKYNLYSAMWREHTAILDMGHNMAQERYEALCKLPHLAESSTVAWANWVFHENCSPDQVFHRTKFDRPISLYEKCAGLIDYVISTIRVREQQIEDDGMMPQYEMIRVGLSNMNMVDEYAERLMKFLSLMDKVFFDLTRECKGIENEELA